MSSHDTHDYPPVRPELVAAKLRAARNGESEQVRAEIEGNPRFVEILFYLAHVSRTENYVGGLVAFARDLVADAGDLIGTEKMESYVKERLTPEQAIEIVRGLPESITYSLSFRNYDYETLCRVLEAGEDDEGGCVEFPSDLACSDDEYLRRCRVIEAINAKNARKRALLKDESEKLCRQPDFWDTIKATCVANAGSELAAWLKRLCEDKGMCFLRKCGAYNSGARAPWYFSRVAEAILRFIDRRKETIAQSLAETTVRRDVFEWMGIAVETKRPIKILGSTRHGKTEAVRAWCAMNPGIARLVETPSSGGERALIFAIACALGLDTEGRVRGFELHVQIEEVLRASGICLVFEEAHLLYPAVFSRSTMPARLNWVRRKIMDAALPCVFVATPQSEHDSRTRFLKATGFAIAQWDGRFLKTLWLEEKVEAPDLLAVARHHFPGVDEDCLAAVAEVAAASERNYCSDVANIAALAFVYARRAGLTVPQVDHVQAAIAEVLAPDPSLSPALSSSRRKDVAKPLQRHSTRPERPAKPAPETHSRGITPHATFEPANRLKSALISTD